MVKKDTETLKAFFARMALLSPEEQMVEFERIRQAVVYPWNELFGRYLDDESISHAGDVASPDFPLAFKDGQIWVLDNFGVLNLSGGALTISGSITYQGSAHGMDIDRTALDSTHHESFLSVPFYFSSVINSTAHGATGTEVVTIHARRIL